MTLRRSARGGGSLQQLAPGRWRSQGIDPTGRRRSHVHHVTTKREAIEAHTRFMTRLGAGELVRSDRTLNDLLDRWLDHKRPELAPATWYRYNLRVNVVRRHLGKVKLDRITPSLLDEFYRHPDITPHTARGIAYTIVGPALQQARLWGWIANNPAKDAKAPTSRARDMHPPTYDELWAFVRALLRDGPQWFGIFVHLLAVTGCRKGEALGLRWDDIDWTTGTIRIERSVYRTPATGVAVKAPKTARGRRAVTIDAGTLTMLEAWAGSERLVTRSDPATSSPLAPAGYIFPGDAAAAPGLPLSPGILDRTFRDTKATHRFPYRMHDIRHAAATTLLSGGVQIRTVADILGHARPEVTIGIYAHSLPRDHTAAAALLAGPAT
jgi:integrase